MSNINFLNRFLEYVILLIPLLLITGPLLSDIAIFLSMILIIIILRRKIFDQILSCNLNKVFIIFYFYLILVCFLHPLKNHYFIESIIPSAFYFRYLFFLVAFNYIFINKKDFSSNLLKILLVIVCLLSIDIIKEYFFGQNLLGYKFNNARIQSLFGDEWIVGSYINYIVPIIISLIFINKKKKVFGKQFGDYSIFGILFLSVFLVTLSGERSALFSIILYSILIICILKFNYLKRIIFVSFLSIIFLSSIILFKPTYERIYKHTFNQLNIFSPNYKKDHQLLFETGIKIYQENKFFGTGLKGFRNECKKEVYYQKNGCSTHPHNFYIQFLVELGLIGFLFLSLIFFIMLLIIFFKKQNFYLFNLRNQIFNNENYSIMIGLFVFIFPFKTHGSFFNNWLSICFYLQLSLFLSTYYMTYESKK